MNLQYAYTSGAAAFPLETEGREEPLRLWFALSVSPRHEKTVSQALNHKGFETFLPTYGRRHQYQSRIRQFELPLFPGYVFCRAEPATRLPILTTPGVLRFLGSGRVPIPIDNHEIESLQRAMEAGIEMSPCPFWQSGQSGRITAGPLTGIQGTIVTVKQSLRLTLSVTLLQRSVLLEIDSGCVSPT